MLSQSGNNEQDETNEAGIFQQNLTKRKELGKKRAQSPNIRRGLRKKIQKCLQGPEEPNSYDLQHTKAEMEKDMFIGGTNEEPCSHEGYLTSPPNAESDVTVGKKHLVGRTELNRQSALRIPRHTNNPVLNCGDLTNSACMDKRYKLEEMQIPGKHEEEDRKSKERCSSTIVEHILKELQGINKIQEEISDLRQYLTSVSGSVDEVSCCVDAVLMEIEELYSGGASGHPSPQRLMTPHRNLGKHKPVAGGQKNKSPLLKKPVKSERNATLQPSPRKSKLHDYEISDHPDESSCRIHHSYPHRDWLYVQEFPSTSSLSSGHSSKSRGQECSCHSREDDPQRGQWDTLGMPQSTSGEGGWSGDTGWSEDEVEDVRQRDTRCRYNGGETSSTPGHSSQSSSEHLSLLFGHQYSSLSSLSSAADWRHPRKQAVPDVDCDCTPNCPYSRSSGYHTMDPYADELCSGPSRSLSCSTMGLTDYGLTDDDGCQDLHSSCEHCLGIGHVDVDSGDSTERVWPERGHTSMSDVQCGAEYSENTDADCAQPPNVGIDVVKISKTMLTFRSALRGALKRLEVADPHCPHENTSDIGSTPDKHSEDPLDVDSTVDGSDSDHFLPSSCETLDLSLSPQKRGGARFHGEHELNNLKLQPCDSQLFDPEGFTSGTPSASCTPTEYFSMDHSVSEEEHLSEQEFFHVDGSSEINLEKEIPSSETAENCPEEMLLTEMPRIACEGIEPRSLGTVLEAKIEVNQVEAQVDPDGDNLEQLDPHHQKCLANIQRVLKEQKQRHKLSRISSGSKHTFSVEEFNPGITCTNVGGHIEKLLFAIIVNQNKTLL